MMLLKGYLEAGVCQTPLWNISANPLHPLTKRLKKTPIWVPVFRSATATSAVIKTGKTKKSGFAKPCSTKSNLYWKRSGSTIWTKQSPWFPSLTGKLNEYSHSKYLLPAVLCMRSEEHTSELQSRGHLVCRLLLEK